jgi:hypothetical protein
MTRWARWWPLTGIAFVALYFIAFVVSTSPDSHDTDSEILAHYAKHSNRVRDFVTFFLVLAALLVLVWFLSLLRDRLIQTEGRAGVFTALAFGSGLVAGALWLVGIASFTAPSGAISETSKFKLDPNTFRLLNDLGYGIWFSGTTIMAILVFATAILSLRTGFLPKWLAWLSFVVGATMLVAFFFIPFLIMLGWFLVTSITLIVRPWRPTAQPPPVPQ